MINVASGGSYRTEPSVHQILEQWLDKPTAKQPGAEPRNDTSRAELYSLDTWPSLFKQMRETAPINKAAGTAYGDYWNVCTHALVQEVEEKPELFSSSWRYGGITIADPLPGQDFELPMFIAMDEPEHSAQRRTLAPAFTPAQVNQLGKTLRETTASVLDRLPRGTTFDWVEQVSIELATQMLATLLGFPLQDRHLLTFWSDWAADMEASRIEELSSLRRDILGEMAHYFHTLWKERCAAPPKPDLLSMMVHSDHMSKMSEFEFMGNLALLIVGGNDTSRNSMSAAVVALEAFPDERQRLEADPSLIPSAVHEILRWHTPISHMRRTATATCDLGGQKIAQGDKLALWYISANRDAAVFDDPDKLDISRRNARRHLAFGHGIHRCIGARLADLQMRILLEELAVRRLRATVVGDIKRVHGNFTHGFRKIEVQLRNY